MSNAFLNDADPQQVACQRTGACRLSCGRLLNVDFEFRFLLRAGAYLERKLADYHQPFYGLSAYSLSAKELLTVTNARCAR